MRFSELNGPEEYDNTHLYIDWPALFEHGLQLLFDYKEWIERQKDHPEVWKDVPEDQKLSIARTLEDINSYDTSKSVFDKKNIWVIRNRLQKYMSDLFVGIRTYDGQTGILNGRMARGKGHKKDLITVVQNQRERDKEISIGEEARRRSWRHPFGGE